MFDNVTPHHMLPVALPLTICSCFILAIGFTVFIFLTGDRGKRVKKTGWLQHTSRTKLAVLFMIMLIIVLGIWLGLSSYRSAVYNSSLESAKTHFVVTQYGIMPQEKVDQMLVELEHAWQQLKDQVAEPQSSSTIQVHLYADIEEYRKYTGAPSWSGGEMKFTIEGPELDLLIEQDGTQSNNELITLNAVHEMTHVVTYMIVGPQQMETIPRWFNEGLANYEMVKGKWYDIDKVFSRDSLRYFVWRNWEYITSNQVLLSYIPNDSSSAMEVDTFYNSSFELVRFLVNNYGEESLFNILRKVGHGEDFRQAFIITTGEDYDHAYAEWLGSF